MFHEVVGGNLKGFFDSLSDCNGRHHHNKLAPAVLLVQLEHGFDIHIGFTGTGFHLDIQAAPPQLLHQLRRELDIVLALDFLDIGKQLLIGQRHSLVFVASIVEGICQLLVLTGTGQHRLIDRGIAFFAQIPYVADFIVIPLSGKDLDNSLYRISLILLNFEIKLHCNV